MSSEPAKSPRPPSLSMDRLIQDVDRINAIVDRALTASNQTRILGQDVMPLLASRSIPPMAVVKLALLTDCLRVVDLAVMADGVVTRDELEHIVELVFPVARYLSRLRSDYEPYAVPDPAGVEEFLIHYRKDSDLFGRECPATHWLGLEICRRVAVNTRDSEVLDLYEDMAINLMDEVIGRGGASDAERRERTRLKDLIELKKRVEDSASLVPSGPDPRISAFCDSNGPEVFTTVAHSTHIWQRDPTDVESIHSEARGVFERLVERLALPDAVERGRILLVLGESGSGKTHLMRAFRNYLHGRRLGYAGYLQMSTRTNDYARYVLVNLIDSLERPYDVPDIVASGLMSLADAVVEAPDGISAADVERLRDGSFDSEAGKDGPESSLDDYISELCDRILDSSGYGEFDPDTLRALLYLQRRESPLSARVRKYLRCEELRDRDRRLLGDIPNRRIDDPLRMVVELGRLMWSTQRAALVLVVDQLEDIYDLEDTRERFRNAMGVCRQITDHVPSSIVVIACLENLYTALKPHLSRATLDRIERDPDPVHLTSRRSYDEIEAIVVRRLSHLYESLGLQQRDDDSLFPFRRDQLSALTNLRTRDVLDWCRRYQERSIAAGELCEAPPALAAPEQIAGRAEQPSSAEVVAVEQAWNDFRTGQTFDLPQEDSELLQLLSWAIGECAADIDAEMAVRGQPDGEMMQLEVKGPASPAELRRSGGEQQSQILLVAMCNHGAQGGWLGKQIAALRKRAGDRRPVAVRSSEFPQSPKSRVARDLGQMIVDGGRRVVVEDSDWRTIQAFREFSAEQQDRPEFAAWRRDTRPLAQLEALRAVLGVDEIRTRRKPVAQEPTSAQDSQGGEQDGKKDGKKDGNQLDLPNLQEQPNSADQEVDRDSVASQQSTGRPSSAATPAKKSQELRAGMTQALSPEPVYLTPASLCRHAAFLGSTGSGKTTLALNLIEQLLVRDVPAVLVDRKGDLVGYADPAAWRGEPGDAALGDRKQRLDERLDVRVYTPGEPAGRPLSIPIVPPAMTGMTSHDRNKVARYAAAALGAMINYKDNATDRARLGILAKAIELISQLKPESAVSISELIDLIHSEDPALVNAIGRLDTRHFAKLVDHLETLRLTRGELLAARSDHPDRGSGTADMLDPDELFGLGRHRVDGNTRLSIISTKFLGDQAAIEFWVARLLVEIGRWASKSPSSELQAVLLIDEADIYLPAVGKPATKEPMQDLLKRARSAGIAVFLATQSPGDLDYKSRDNIGTWLVGRIAEKRAVAKMRPLFSECRIDVSKKLAKQGVGEFAMLRGGDVTFFKAERSLLHTRQLGEDEIVALARPDNSSGNQP